MKKTIIIHAIAVVTGAACAIFGLTLYQAVYVSESEVSMPNPPPQLVVIHSATSTEPAVLDIPAISVHATVQQVGVTAKGALGVPTNFTDVAWYKYGPVPGAVGNAIIDGHLDNALSLAGVFKHLADVKAGDDIYVTNISGQKLHFIVSKIESLPYNATSTQEIFGPSTAAHLILITCEGSWNESIKEYSDRLVVFSNFISF